MPEKKYHCQNCNKVLFFGDLREGIISKDCPKCGERNIFIAERKIIERFDTVKKEVAFAGTRR